MGMIESGGADRRSYVKKKAILNTSDNVEVQGQKYYVSADADAESIGTEADPIRIEDVNSLSLNAGDAVLFKRGDTFRMSTRINAVSGVTYAAYGEGYKPMLYGSERDYKNSYWFENKTVGQNIWSIDAPKSVHNIVFNGGEQTGTKKDAPNQLTTNGDYWYAPDHANGTLYLYCEMSPAAYYSNIELFTTSSAFNITVDDVTIDNIAMKYFGGHTVRICSGQSDREIKNITVENCEIGFGGGAVQDNTRLGNGIEVFGPAENINMNNNWVYQQYDAGITFQYGGVAEYDNINIKNNLVEYCSYNIEYFVSIDKGGASWLFKSSNVSNIDISGNILRFAGYGLGMKRYSSYGVANFNGWDTKIANVSNFKIQNNIFDCSAKNLVNWIWTGDESNTYASKYTISGNTFYQKYYDVNTSPVTLKSTLVENAAMWWGNKGSVSYSSTTAANSEELLIAVQTFDSSATANKVAYIDVN